MKNKNVASQFSILIQKFERELKLHGKSQATTRTYSLCLKRFLSFFHGKDVTKFTLDEINDFKESLIDGGMKGHYINQHIFCIEFFYKFVIRTRRFDVRDIVKVPREKSVPVTIPREQILAIFNASRNEKFKMIFMLMYATGMRVKECVNLKIEDIKSDRMLILVRNGKGKKERFVPLDKTLLYELRKYYVTYKVDKKEWLFPKERNMFHHVTTHHVQHELRRIRRDLNLSEDYTTHCFRHSFASHLLEDGVDIRVIQKLLGHVNLQTTMHYVRVSEKTIKSITIPTTKLLA